MNPLIAISACIYCDNQPLILSKDKMKMVCKSCSREFLISNNHLIVDVYESKVDLSALKKPFHPKKGQSNWRALSYYSAKDFFSTKDKDKVVLDLGCGPQTNLNILRKFKKRISLDLFQFQGVDIVCDFTKKLPLLDNSVELILCSNLLEHMPNPEHLIKESSRVLRRERGK